MTAPFPRTLRTERLRLSPLEAVDVHAFNDVVAADDGIEAVTEFLPWDPHGDVAETRAFLDGVRAERAAGDGAQWVVRIADTGAIAGAVSLAVDWPRRTAELGIWLRKQDWGRGFARESLDAVLAVALDSLDCELVVARVRPENDRSRRAFEAFVDDHDGREAGVCRTEWVSQDGTVHDAVRYENPASER